MFYYKYIRNNILPIQNRVVGLTPATLRERILFQGRLSPGSHFFGHEIKSHLNRAFHPFAAGLQPQLIFS